MILDVIYIDVLIVLNIYVTYFLIKATARITHASVKLPGLIVASVVGSLFSLLILADISFITLFIVKAAAAFLIVFLAFREKRKRVFIKLTAAFYIMNFIFAGIIMGIGDIFKTDHISVNNSFVYFDVSLLNLIILTAVSYFIVCAIRFIIDKSTVTDGIYFVTIKNNSMTFILEGLADTGNTLTDAFSGRPVIICSEKFLEKLTGSEIKSENIYNILVSDQSIKGVRLVPYSTINGAGAVPAFIPDEVIIKNERMSKSVDVLIGIKYSEEQAIFNPRILI